MQRLSPLDALFLQSDSPTVPRQIATLAILEAGETSLDHDRLRRIIDERIDLVPRYRQVPRHVPGRIGIPSRTLEQMLDTIGTPLAHPLGELPAVLALHAAEQALEVRQAARAGLGALEQTP